MKTKEPYLQEESLRKLENHVSRGMDHSKKLETLVTIFGFQVRPEQQRSLLTRHASLESAHSPVIECQFDWQAQLRVGTPRVAFLVAMGCLDPRVFFGLCIGDVGECGFAARAVFDGAIFLGDGAYCV